MSTTINITPYEYSCSKNLLPFSARDTDSAILSKYKYILNLTFNGKYSSTSDVYPTNNKLYTKLTIINHNFNIGDKVYVNLFGSYLAYNIIVDIIDANNIAIDKEYQPTNSNYLVSNVIALKYNPDINNSVEVDLHYICKDLVFSKMPVQTTNGLVNANSTRSAIKLYLTREYIAVLKFTDNAFYTGGKVGFVTNAASVADIPFRIGDTISVQQEMLEENITSITDDGNGYLKLEMSSPSQSIGQTVYIKSDTEPSYNNSFVITDIYSNYIILNGRYVQDTNDDTLYSIPTPSYNTVTTIIDLYLDQTLNRYVIATNVNWTVSTPAIKGVIKGINTDKKLELLSDTTQFEIFDSLQEDYNYVNTFYKDYILYSTAVYRKLSTIYKPNKIYNLSTTTTEYIRFHYIDYNSSDVKINYKIFDASNNLLTDFTFDNNLSYSNYYWNLNIQDTINRNGTLNSGQALSDTLVDGNIIEMTVLINDDDNGDEAISQTYKFKITDYCSINVIDLIWKDKLGSYISLPMEFYNKMSIARVQSDIRVKQMNVFNNTSQNQVTKQFANKRTNVWELNTGWLTNEDNEFVIDLFDSTEHYISIEGKIYNVRLLSKSIQVIDNYNSKMIQYKFSVEVNIKVYN